MTGYVRADTSNSLANGQTADAGVLDNEFDAIVAAFDSTSGHAHDGSSAEGAPITVMGPAQDFVAGGSSLYPKTTNLYDLGNATFGWRDVYATRSILVGGAAVLTAASTATLTNKTFSLTSNTLTGTAAELATAITGTTGTGSLVFAASPALTGTPTAPTAAAGTNTTQLATTAFVNAERTNTATLTNKTFNLGSNTLVATSAQLAAALTDETGTGAAVFANSPALAGTPTAPTAAPGNNSTQIATTAFVVQAVVGGSVDPFPTGGIILWSGAIVNIPSGWGLCDGTGGTPDLRGRMVIGAGGTYAVGDTGGNTTITLSEAQLPSHTHTFSATTSSGGSHNHTGSTSAAGAHSHTYSPVYTPTGIAQNGYLDSDMARFQSIPNGTLTSNVSTPAVGDHTHTFTTSTATAHTHSVSGTTSATGSGSAINILNPYYALAYIMKL